MKFTCSMLVAGLGVTVLGFQVSAADFFVQALQPGPVVGVPLSAISLRGWAGDYDSEAPAITESDLQEGVSGATQPDITTKAWASETDARAIAPFTPAKSKWIRSRKPGEATGLTTDSPTFSATNITTAAEKSIASTNRTAGATPALTETGAGILGATMTSTSPSGSAPVRRAGRTFQSFDALINSGKVHSGDRIFLLGGHHGVIVVKGQKYSTPVQITSMPGQVAQVDAIVVRDSKNVIFSRLKVWTTGLPNGQSALIRSYSDTSNLTFVDLDVRSTANATNYKNWIESDWVENQRNGIMVDGHHQTVFRSRLTGVYNGILAFGSSALIEENIVDGFFGDAMRALGDNSIIRRNKVQNCHQIDATHTDGFQSYSRGPDGTPGAGVVRNVLVDGNKIFEFVGTRSSLNCKLQGIGLFDGMYDGWVIRNNVIFTSAYHGITISGGLNSLIVNNTVAHISGLAGSFPWIRVSPHKNGTSSQSVIVQNNLANAIKVENDASKAIFQGSNVIVTNAASDFTAFPKLDFSLRSTSKAVDAGTKDLAPISDIRNRARPAGRGPDAGAYESF